MIVRFGNWRFAVSAMSSEVSISAVAMTSIFAWAAPAARNTSGRAASPKCTALP